MYLRYAALLFAVSATFPNFVSCDKYVNKFHNINGCKQANAVTNYNAPVDFIPTEHFENVGAGANSTFFRIGIFGKADAVIRFSKVAMPYNRDTVHELVIGAGMNRHTEARRQVRNNVALHRNHVLKKIPTPDILSELEPFVLTVEFVQGGLVRLTRDGETAPFLEFSDPGAEISFTYIGFSNWLGKVIYFFDCPVYNFDLRTDSIRV